MHSPAFSFLASWVPARVRWAGNSAISLIWLCWFLQQQVFNPLFSKYFWDHKDTNISQRHRADDRRHWWTLQYSTRSNRGKISPPYGPYLTSRHAHFITSFYTHAQNTFNPSPFGVHGNVSWYRSVARLRQATDTYVLWVQGPCTPTRALEMIEQYPRLTACYTCCEKCSDCGFAILWHPNMRVNLLDFITPNSHHVPPGMHVYNVLYQCAGQYTLSAHLITYLN